jgi:16S rRNA (cytosine967-C5)-methyltransferase
MKRRRSASSPEAAGLPARLAAAGILDGVLRRNRPLDEQLDGTHAHLGLAALSERDRALVRRIVATTLRRLGTLRHVLGRCLERGSPVEAPRVETALLIGAAQIFLLDVPDHAAVDLSVRIAQADRQALHFAGLVNAVLRRLARDRSQLLADFDSLALDTPDWLMRRWIATYGPDTARAIAQVHSHEPSLDLTVKSEPQSWAARLGGRVLPTGSVRLNAHGAVPQLPGFADGAWWVQDAAAALPARLLGDVRGLRVADLCAAPGGKTAQLAAAGARVTAVDRSAPRLARLRENLARLKLDAESVVADVAEWDGGPFDAVLLDAPCSSTGRIRRHPDIPWLKRAADVAQLAAVQARLIARAVGLVRPGGTIVYCVCSLEPEEGIDVVSALLARDPRLRRRPIAPADIGGVDEFLTPAGDLHTLPCHWPDPDPAMAGLDGFYAARLERL